MVDAIAHVDIKPPRLPKQGFVARGAAAMAVAGRFALAIGLRFHNHAPEQRARGLAFQQQAAHQLRGHDVCGAGEEGLGEGWDCDRIDLGGGQAGGCNIVRQAIIRKPAYQ